jgi:hypothetical protein
MQATIAARSSGSANAVSSVSPPAREKKEEENDV